MVDVLDQAVLDAGRPERSSWLHTGGAVDIPEPLAAVWSMVTEASTGFSGSFARQVTLNESTANAALTADLLSALEWSAGEGGIVACVREKGAAIGRDAVHQNHPVTHL